MIDIMEKGARATAVEQAKELARKIAELWQMNGGHGPDEGIADQKTAAADLHSLEMEYASLIKQFSIEKSELWTATQKQNFHNEDVCLQCIDGNGDAEELVKLKQRVAEDPAQKEALLIFISWRIRHADSNNHWDQTLPDLFKFVDEVFGQAEKEGVIRDFLIVFLRTRMHAGSHPDNPDLTALNQMLAELHPDLPKHTEAQLSVLYQARVSGEQSGF